MFKKNPQGIYQFDELMLPGLVHGFSTKAHGNMDERFDSGDVVTNNRKHFLSELKIQNTAMMVLEHGTKIMSVDNPGIYQKADGLITNQIGLGLMFWTADCLPIIFYDPKKRVIGAIHSGWIGTVGKISTMATAKMMANFGCEAKNILVGIGPSIGKCCYIKPKLGFNENFAEWKNYIIDEPNDSMRVDFNGFVYNQLVEIGILPNNIFRSDFCTKDHYDEFYCSQVNKSGRFASVIQMI